MEYEMQLIGPSKVDTNIPKFSPDAYNKFTEEAKTLVRVWHEVIAQLNQDNSRETEFKEGNCYKIYEHRRPLTWGGATFGVSGLAGTITSCIYPNPYCIIPMLSMLGGVVTCLLPCFNPSEARAEDFKETRKRLNESIKKIEKVAGLINKIGDLVVLWEAIKKDPSREQLKNLDALFKVFKEVQKAEVGLTTQKRNRTEKLFLFNSLCQARELPGQTDIKIIEDWKSFMLNPQIWATEKIQPIEFPAIKASREAYNNFLIFHESKNESQVDSKVALLRDYIRREFK